MTTIVERPADLANYIGKKLGSSDWFEIGQPQIDAFAQLTGDDLWIHVDPARAEKEMPGGKTIVHGFYVLSLIPFLQRSVFKVEQRGKGLNYGCNRIRFTSPVAVGSRVRLHQAIKECEVLENGARTVFECTVEVEGQERPALVAETIVQIFDK
jgi:acyl dehydratase